MPTRPKLTNVDLYDRTPNLCHSAGDIWSGLPSYGLLGNVKAAALVVTPPCDLVQRKVETITYLPILPVARYFTTSAFLPATIRAIRGQLTVALPAQIFDATDRYLLPPAQMQQSLREKITPLLTQANVGAKEKGAAGRIGAGLDLLGAASREIASIPPPGCLDRLFGQKDWQNIVQSIVKNSFSPDLHFLPPDGQPAEWSAIVEPSVVMFRYPLTAPIQVLDAAQDIGIQDWPAAIERFCPALPASANFNSERPLKRATLNPRFFADLLTRYIGMHVRLGSPDFSDETLQSYIDGLKGVLA